MTGDSEKSAREMLVIYRSVNELLELVQENMAEARRLGPCRASFDLLSQVETLLDEVERRTNRFDDLAAGRGGA